MYCFTLSTYGLPPKQLLFQLKKTWFVNLLFRLLLTTAQESWFSLLWGTSCCINHSYASLLKLLKQEVCLQLTENLSSFVLTLIWKTKTLIPRSVTSASIKDAHCSFLNYKHFKKGLKNAISHKKFCIPSGFLFIHTHKHILYIIIFHIPSLLYFLDYRHMKKLKSQISVIC